MFKTLKSIKKQSTISVPLISVCVRLKNEISYINLFWESLKKQTLFNSVEIVFIDSGSTDGTLEFLTEQNCNIYSIDPSEFSFGKTCNLAMELTSCRLTYLFSGHVIIEQNDALEKSFKFLAEQENASGYFRQIPNYQVGCSIYDETFLKFRYPLSDKGSQLVKYNQHSFSNAASIINRESWMMVKFKDIIASEDYYWANEVITNGGLIFYFSKQNVLHSHNESYHDVYKRVNINARARFPNGVSLLKDVIIFNKIFFALLFNSWNPVISIKYAYAHTKAYADIKK